MEIIKKLSLVSDDLLNQSLKLKWTPYLILSAWVMYYLYIILDTGFISDDAYNSQIRGTLIQDGISIYDRTLNEILGWAKGAGRFYPLAFYVYILYYFTQSLIIVKSITLAIIIINVLLFFTVVKNLSGSVKIGLLIGLVLPVFFQFRLWHDPILAFTFLLPLLFFYILSSLVLYQQYLINGKNIYLFSSSVLFLLALMTYEVSYPFCIIYFVLAYARELNVRRSILLSSPYITLSFLFTGFFLLLKTGYNPFLDKDGLTKTTYEGVQLHLNIIDVVKTFVIQTSAAIPLSYYFNAKNIVKNIYYWSDLIFLGIFYTISFKLFIRIVKQDNIKYAATVLILTGACMLFIPSLVISVSGHQKQIIAAGFGFGYLPVYIQYYGICLLIIVGVFLFLSKRKQESLVTITRWLAGVLTVVAVINLGQNRAVATNTNMTYKHPRQFLAKALESGIVDDLTDKAIIIRHMRFPTDYTWFYTLITNRIFDMCEISDSVALKKCIDDNAAQNIQSFSVYKNSLQESEIVDLGKLDMWALSYVFDHENGHYGRLYLGKIDSIERDAATYKPIQLVVKKLRIFQFEEDVMYDLDFSKQPIDFLKIVDEESDGATALKKFKANNYTIDDFILHWGAGFYGKKGTRLNNLRWSEANSKLLLYNHSSKVKKIRLTMKLITANPETANINIRYRDSNDSLVINNVPTVYSLDLKLKPGKNVIDFYCDGSVIANGDPKKMVFGVLNFESAWIDM